MGGGFLFDWKSRFGAAARGTLRATPALGSLGPRKTLPDSSDLVSSASPNLPQKAGGTLPSCFEGVVPSDPKAQSGLSPRASLIRGDLALPAHTETQTQTHRHTATHKHTAQTQTETQTRTKLGGPGLDHRRKRNCCWLQGTHGKTKSTSFMHRQLHGVVVAGPPGFCEHLALKYLQLQT